MQTEIIDPVCEAQNVHVRSLKKTKLHNLEILQLNVDKNTVVVIICSLD